MSNSRRPDWTFDSDRQVTGDQHQDDARHKVVHVDAPYVQIAGDPPPPLDGVGCYPGERDVDQEGAEDEHLRLAPGQHDPVVVDAGDVVPQAATGVRAERRTAGRLHPTDEHVAASCPSGIVAVGRSG
jgi:hypothetical protein